MELFPGQDIFLKHTGEWGRILDMLPGQYLEVHTDSGETSIVHMDDIWLEEEYYFEEAEKKETKHSVAIPAHSKPFIEKTWSPPGTSLYVLLVTDDPAPLGDEYQCWIINQTPYTCEIKGMLRSREGELFEETVLLDQGMKTMLCEIFREDLSAQLRLDIHAVFELEADKVIHESRIRFHPAKILENRIKHNEKEWLIWYPVINSEELTIPKTTLYIPAEKPVRKQKSHLAPIRLHNIEEKAAFPLSIDLHAEKLLPNHKSLTSQVILQKQKEAFQRYIYRAVQLGIDKVFIVHGVGEGKLRQYIHDHLDNLDHVSYYVNEYHPKYGYGATEVLF